LYILKNKDGQKVTQYCANIEEDTMGWTYGYVTDDQEMHIKFGRENISENRGEMAGYHREIDREKVRLG
jgi:hypothetical protein